MNLQNLDLLTLISIIEDQALSLEDMNADLMSEYKHTEYLTKENFLLKKERAVEKERSKSSKELTAKLLNKIENLEDYTRALTSDKTKSVVRIGVILDILDEAKDLCLPQVRPLLKILVHLGYRDITKSWYDRWDIDKSHSSFDEQIKE